MCVQYLKFWGLRRNQQPPGRLRQKLSAASFGTGVGGPCGTPCPLSHPALELKAISNCMGVFL